MIKLKNIFIVGTVTIMLLSLRGSPGDITSAQENNSSTYYLPIFFQPEPILLDDFTDQDPVWTRVNLQSEHPNPDLRTWCWSDWQNRNLFYCEIRDDSDRIVYTPEWRPQGDFSLEVRARFDRPYIDKPPFQTRNGLGLVFGGSDDWGQQYAFLLGYYGSQHAWALMRFDSAASGDNTALAGFWKGAPGFVNGFDGWNHLQVVRIKNTIALFCNGFRMPMPGPDYTHIEDGRYGTNRLVGLTLTSWEADFDKIEFDHFKLTPLSLPY